MSSEVDCHQPASKQLRSICSLAAICSSCGCCRGCGLESVKHPELARQLVKRTFEDWLYLLHDLQIARNVDPAENVLENDSV